MAKQTGLGDNFYVGGYNISGDVNSLSNISGSVAPIDVTDITQSAHSRLGGQRDGEMVFTVYMDNSPVSATPTGAHGVLGALPTGDVILSYFRGTGIGNSAASMNAKQIDYDGTRTTAGEYTLNVDADANAYGLEWGTQLTPGVQNVTSVTSLTAVSTPVSASFGAQAYVHLFSLTGTDITINIQDSADNVSFTTISSLSFGALTSAPQALRQATASNALIRQYVRVNVSTSGGFSNANFAVVFVKNYTAVAF